MKKIILCILICLGPIFLMSHNVGAIEITQSPQIIYAGYPFKMTAFSENCYDTQHTCPSFIVGWTNNYSGRYGSNFNGLSLSLPAMTYESDWLVYQFILNNSRSTSANHSGFFGLTRDTSNASINFDVVSYQFEQLTDNDSLLTVYIKMKGEQVVTNSQNLNGLRMVGASGSWLQLQAPANAASGVGITTMSLNIFRDIPGQDYSSSINAINDKLNSTNSKLDDINNTLEQQQQDEEDALDDATTDAQDGADDSSQDATNATTGLISVISGFVSAVTSATPSDCKINGNMGHLNIGNIDMCSLPVPSFVQIIGSIILILVCIPFVIIMFNRFISLFRSFQG